MHGKNIELRFLVFQENFVSSKFVALQVTISPLQPVNFSAGSCFSPHQQSAPTHTQVNQKVATQQARKALFTLQSDTTKLEGISKPSEKLKYEFFTWFCSALPSIPTRGKIYCGEQMAE